MESWSQSPSSSEELERLREQVAALTRRVAALERQAGTFAGGVPTAAANATPQTESRAGLTLVNRIGALTLALGILFFFKYAADNHWIGPMGRLVAGLFAGLCFVAFGEWLRRSTQAVLAQGIIGCGFAILYITSYASSSFYHLLLTGASFVLMAITGALAVVWAIRMKSQGLAIAGFIGVMLTPVLLRVPRGVWEEGFLLVAVMAGISVATAQRWPVVVGTNLALAALCSLILDQRPINFAIGFAVLAAGHWLARSKASEPAALANTLYVAGHAALLLVGLKLIDAGTSQSSVALTLASILLTIYGMGLLSLGVSRGSNVNRLLGLTCVGLVIAKLYLYDVWRLSYEIRITAFVVLGILLLGASFIYSRWKTRT